MMFCAKKLVALFVLSFASIVSIVARKAKTKQIPFENCFVRLPAELVVKILKDCVSKKGEIKVKDFWRVFKKHVGADRVTGFEKMLCSYISNYIDMETEFNKSINNNLLEVRTNHNSSISKKNYATSKGREKDLSSNLFLTGYLTGALLLMAIGAILASEAQEVQGSQPCSIL